MQISKDFYAHTLVFNYVFHCMTVIRPKHVAFTDEFNKSLLCLMAMVQPSLHRPAEALTVLWRWGSQISKQSKHECRRLSALCNSHLYPQEIFLVLISVRGWVNPRPIAWLEGLNQWKIPVTPLISKPATFWL